ncbi:MAG: O-antigen ligase family protein [Deltaproteobacteria bacterium]
MDNSRYGPNYPLLNNLAFYALLGSGAFIILLNSPNVLGGYIKWTLRTLIFIFPWLMLCLAFSWQTIIDKNYRVEILCLAAIIMLGIINTALSDSFAKSFPKMQTFLLTGIFALWVSMFLFTDGRRRRIFDWFCCGCLVIVVVVELLVWSLRGANGSQVFEVFIRHPIPLGTLIILLSSGPVRLLTSKDYKTKFMAGFLALLTGILIFYTHKRGTWLALAVIMAGGIIFLAHRKKFLMISLLVLLALAITLKTTRMVARLNPQIPHYASVLQRLELYPFALHVWKCHPLMGIGLRPFTHQKYLEDYQQHNKNLQNFPESVAKLQTFDNMLLTGFVELGTVMTLFYMALVIIIIVRYSRTLRSSLNARAIDWYRLLILLGFAVHSMTYDSLLFPQLNWLFHVQLGLMAGYSASERAYSPDGWPQRLPESL